MGKTDEIAIFTAAAELSGAARDAFLQEACQGDEALRDRLARYLRHRDSSGPLDEVPSIVAATVPVAPHELVGHTIGPYKLRELLGEGGMGLVYVAEQTEPIRRKVALKVIKPGMATRDVVNRFEAERQVLAIMEHPNIARVFDGGVTEPGQPYFVMELVLGVPITQFCDEQRLSTTERLNLFLQVCRAVHHAHQKGIIHRDVKPSNVLVAEIDGRALPKVIDFGVAKAVGQSFTEQSVYTGVSQMIGTPTYMSPEQATLGVADVDTRSDVYSLGVLLYELLTGVTPFDRKIFQSADFTEVQRILREEEPRRPSHAISTLNAEALSTVSDRRACVPRKFTQTVRGELDWIAMKTLEKDRSRRYDSANALADDIERYLSSEPVEACPPTVTYRLGRFVRRHRRMLATASLIALILTSATAISVGYAIKAGRSKGLADERLEQSEEDYNRALKAVDLVVQEVGSPEFESLPGAQPIREELFKNALGLYDEIISDHGSDKLSRQRRAEALAKMMFIYRDSGQLAQAAEVADESIRVYEQLQREFPQDLNVRRELARAYLARTWALPINGGRKAKLELARKSASLLKGLPKTSEKSGETDEDGWEWAAAHYTIADNLMAMGSLEQAAEAARQATIESGEVAGVATDSWCWLARIQRDLGQLEQAEASARKSIAYARRDITSRPSRIEPRRRLFWALEVLATTLERQGDSERATHSYDEALQLAQQLSFEYPSQRRFQDMVRRSSLSSANGFRQYLENALSHSRMSSLRVFVRMGRERALADVVHKLRNEGSTQQANRLAADLEQCYADVIEADAENVSNWIKRGTFYRALGNNATRLLESEKALADFGHALDIARATDERDTRQIVQLLIDRASLFDELGQVDRALAEWTEVKREIEEVLSDDADWAWGNNTLAEILASSRHHTIQNPVRAVSLAKKAIHVDPYSANYRNTLGVAQYNAGNFEAAIADLMKSTEVAKGANPFDFVFLAMAHWKLGQKGQAREWYDKTVQWMNDNGPANEELVRFRAEAEETLGIESAAEPGENDHSPKSTSPPAVPEKSPALERQQEPQP